MSEFSGDLHVHTCLSPCAELEMSPVNIAKHASATGLHLIAICDHNTCGNVEAVAKAARRQNVAVLPGMEITTSEEVHIVALFPTVEAACKVRDLVFSRLEGWNDAGIFGLQVLADEDDNVVGFEERLLIGATGWSLESTVDMVHEAGGLVIAAHIDRESYGILGRLGFIPDALALDALEVAPGRQAGTFRELAARRGIPLVFSSDAHRLDEIGTARTRLLVAEPTFAELKLAIAGLDGRKVLN